jgi:HAD superfamily hydrolase (TIGR01490 family)
MASIHSPSKETKLAIFDIDGTIFRSSLIIELFNELVRREIFPQQASVKVERNYVAWLNRKGHYNDYIMKLVTVFYRHLAGCNVRTIDAAVRSVVARQKDRIYRYPRYLFQTLRREGYMIIVISNSPSPIVQRFAKAMGFDLAIGHTLQITKGRYTGQSIVSGKLMPGYAFMDKVTILKEFIREYDLRVNLKKSVMIGDSEGDLPLLASVGKPIAFNPSAPLARIAKKRGWKIIVERKDVVYHVRATNFIPVDVEQAQVSYGNHHKK